MKLGLLILLISTIKTAHALECNGIPEGKVFRLDQENRSLSKAAVQDQDGSGVCYSNEASLLLQSIIPGNPNISYLNLALFYATDVTLPTGPRADRSYYTQNSDEKNAAITGGLSCEAINSALKRQKKTGHGVICKSEDVNLEHNFFNQQTGNFTDKNRGQGHVLNLASRYMNLYQDKFGFALDKNSTGAKYQKKREEADKFSAALKKLVAQSSDSYLSNKCTKTNPQKFEKILNNSLIRLLDSRPECIKKNKLQKYSDNCKNFSEFGSFAVTNIEGHLSSQSSFLISDSINTKLASTLPSMYKEAKSFDDFMSKLTNFYKQFDTTDNNEAQKNAFANALTKSISPEDLRDIEESYNSIALKKLDSCKSKMFLEYFKDKNEFLEKSKRDPVLCNYTDVLERASQLAEVIPQKSFNDMTSFVDFIANKAGLKYDEAMLGLIANDCSVDKRVMLPESLQCTPQDITFTPQDFPGTEISANATKFIKKNREKMINNLQKGQAVGLDICVTFWKTPEFDLNKFSSSERYKKCRLGDTTGIHATTMIGYRCKDNRLQYLSQNSWGPNWKEEGNHYEFENGKIWVDEDKIFKNLDRINYISK